MSTTTSTIDVAARRVPPLGGFNATLVWIELKRMLRNRRTVVFTLVLPAALFLTVGSASDMNDPAGSGNISAYVLISMAVYGASLTAAATGAMVAVERAQGWSRQLRVTPLHSVAYVVTKALIALFMGALAILAVNVVGLIQGRAEMPVTARIGAALLTLLCMLTFAALGIFVGYLVPSENAMQILGPILAVLAILGGTFWPLHVGSGIWHVAVFTPMYGVAEVARAPLTHDLPWYAIVNAVAWFALFVAGAAWRMSKDTARV